LHGKAGGIDPGNHKAAGVEAQGTASQVGEREAGLAWLATQADVAEVQLLRSAGPARLAKESFIGTNIGMGSGARVAVEIQLYPYDRQGVGLHVGLDAALDMGIVPGHKRRGFLPGIGIPASAHQLVTDQMLVADPSRVDDQAPGIRSSGPVEVAVAAEAELGKARHVFPHRHAPASGPGAGSALIGEDIVDQFDRVVGRGDV